MKSIIIIITFVQGYLKLEYPCGNFLQIHPIHAFNNLEVDLSFCFFFKSTFFVGFFCVGRNATRAMELFTIHGKRISTGTLALVIQVEVE